MKIINEKWDIKKIINNIIFYRDIEKRLCMRDLMGCMWYANALDTYSGGYIKRIGFTEKIKNIKTKGNII